MIEILQILIDEIGVLYKLYNYMTIEYIYNKSEEEIILTYC